MAIGKIGLILFILSFGFVNGDRNLIVQNIKEDQCDPSAMHILLLMQKYFVNQEVITVISHQVKNSQHNVDRLLLRCIVSKLNMPLYQYRDARQLLLHSPSQVKTFIDTPSITSCYTIAADTYIELVEDLKILSQINPTAKYILVLRSQINEVRAGEKLLKIAWDSYKMLQLIVVIIAVKNNTVSLHVIAYNPFVCVDDDCEIRGKFSKHLVNSTNFNTAIDEIVHIANDQVNNLHQYPLRIYMYEWKSFAKAVPNPLKPDQIIRFRLLDGEILYTMGRHMNFKSIFVGNVKRNTIAGSVQSISDEEADIAMNSRIISDYNSSNTVFATQVYLVALKYIVPKQYTLKMLNVFIYSMFDWNTEIIMIGIFIMLILVWYLLNYFYENFTKQSESNSIPRSMIIVTASQYFISIKFTKFLKGHQQVLLGSMLLYSIVVSSNFQSSIVKQLATDVEGRDIQVLDQLVESPYEIRYVQTLRDFLRIPLNLQKTSTLYRLYNKQKIMEFSIQDYVPQLAYNKTLAILCTKLVAEELASQYLDDNTGRPLIHIVRQDLAAFFYSYIVPKSSPYRLRINDFIRRAIEGGIIEHEQEKIQLIAKMNTIKAIKRYGRNPGAGRTGYKGVTIQQFESLFVVWGYLLTLALFVFIIELSVFYLYPQYQKYQDKHDL